jgi:hypothetical protein
MIFFFKLTSDIRWYLHIQLLVLDYAFQFSLVHWVMRLNSIH